ncbi:MAG TPA: ATP-dependent Clp protease ATP-binding subunit ClpA, partial [Gammaproteobacteria bacterium]|nr:ATP-dependent Clp protease ATP-binding subunit ClpA [Gammaproteobacteria bacterium]
LKKLFSPEFRNRLDAIIPFEPLDELSVARVVDKLIVELEAQLDKNQVTIELHPAAREWVAKRGYDKKMGARPMARVIQEHIKRPLAEELLFGKLTQGGHVRVEVAPGGEGLVLIPEPLTPELEHLPEIIEPGAAARGGAPKPSSDGPAPRRDGEIARNSLDELRKLVKDGKLVEREDGGSEKS